MPEELYDAENRPIRLSGRWDKLIVTDLRGREGISELFHYEINVVSQDGQTLDPADILLQSLTIEMHMEATPRYINGIVKSVVQGPLVQERGLIQYTLELVPKAWLLTHGSFCRIFQEQTAIDIVKKVLKDCGVEKVENRTQRTFSKREYCVQYNETNFAFISRLMEFEGVFFFFTHKEDDHTMILGDDNTIFEAVPITPDIEYDDLVGGLRQEGRIQEWHNTHQVRTGGYQLCDYNFKKPKLNLKVKDSGDDGLLYYENPGGYDAPSDGEALAKLRVQEELVSAIVIRGRSVNWNLGAAYKFVLKNHFSGDNEKQFTLTRVTQYITQPLEAKAGEEAFRYENEFACIPFEKPYRPARLTPLPTVRGVQTAVVTGPGGEEIYTDEYGRIKVRFHWDTDPEPEGASDDKSSCWIRVATSWAGAGWGAIHIPRIGQEVVVDFVDGDVDRPLIIGSVYHATNPVPYPLPAEKTKSVLKSNSSPGGGGSNEFRFEDKKGSEEVFFHAEKDHNTMIKHDETRKVGNDRTTLIEHDEVQEVKNNETIRVKEGNQTIILDQGTQSTSIKQGDQLTKISMGNQATKIEMGNQTTKLNLGAASHEAMQSITLKVGQSSIVVDQMGVTIKGMIVKIEGQIMVQTKALLIQEQASAVEIIQGGIVLIN